VEPSDATNVLMEENWDHPDQTNRAGDLVEQSGVELSDGTQGSNKPIWLPRIPRIELHQKSALRERSHQPTHLLLGHSRDSVESQNYCSDSLMVVAV